MLFFAPPFINLFNDERYLSQYIKENTHFESFQPAFEHESAEERNNCLELLSDAIKREDFELTKSILEIYPYFTKLNSQNDNWLKKLGGSGTTLTFFDKCFDLALDRSYMNIIVTYLLRDCNQRYFNDLMTQLKPINSNQNPLSQIEKFKAVLLYTAIVKELPKAVAFLLENNVDPNVTCYGLGSPLSVAIKQLKYPSGCSFDKMELSDYQAINPMLYVIIEMLLKKNATQRQQISFGSPFEVYTPLTYSVQAQDLKLFKLLLSYNPHLVDASPIEATTRFLSEGGILGETPLVIATKVKSKKMYNYIMSLCPDLLLKEIGEVGYIMFNKSSYSKFVQHVLSTIPFEQRNLLFQAYRAQRGNEVVSDALRNDSLCMASTLLKFGANLPTATDAIGQTHLHHFVKHRMTSDEWQPLFEKYCQELKAAEATPSLVEMTTNVIHKHTQQNEFAIEALQGYLPQELFELYQSTPQRRENRKTHYKPVIRECLEKALQPKDEAIEERQEKRAKM